MLVKNNLHQKNGCDGRKHNIYYLQQQRYAITHYLSALDHQTANFVENTGLNGIKAQIITSIK